MILSDATFSECRAYRYVLTREWTEKHQLAAFIGLNPSTADETKDDPTVRRCMGFAQDWGYSGIYMLNLFAFRATKPRDLRMARDPVGPANDAHLVRICTMAHIVIACWGAYGNHMFRSEHVVPLLLSKGVVLRAFGTTKSGEPRHPLYLSKGIDTFVWRVRS